MSKPRTYGGGSGESHYYIVEVRSTFSQPMIVNKDFVLDNKWRHLPTQKIALGFGIPTRNWEPTADHLGLMNYEAALALAHYFIADLRANLVTGSGCVEARLVKVQLRYSYSTEEIGVGQIINRTDGPREKFASRQEIGDVPLSAIAEVTHAD